MDAASAPWWVGMIATPSAASAAGALAYIWKQREATQREERAAAAEKERQEREERTARIAALEAALVAARAETAAVQAARIDDHNAHRDNLLALYRGAIDSEGDLREAVRSVASMPAVVREAMETFTASMRLAIREELERTSVNPAPPATKRTAR